MIGILSQVQIGGSPQLLFNDKSLLKKLESSCQELIFDLQEVALANVHFEGLIDNAEAVVILDVLPAAVAIGHDT
ncbi:ChromodomainhelicaseDNAbinding protein Mi2 -like protein [Caligus rogercresseyi]|uniref:ChromodomainhelicaseDNAbinding protein Mi2 -like protein n=1 Tax=Caligus rogercresseyi TaxID=217165 RepID=A0A7T8HEL1_CALRO|nr:ChromodomainhelicaseDNAbinding protein Mi2 -like protein [Caligus rogercresseyi]